MTALASVETVQATDADLVVLATAGDRDAFRVLFDRHAHRVAAACRQKLRAKTDVDDAVQEAFARALANLDQLRNPEQFGAWVRSIAVRACLDHHRNARRVIVVDDEVHAERADSAPQPDEVFEAADHAASVRSLLMQLGERDRQALFMRHINEAAVPEIADELGLTEGSTRVMLTRARERLRLVAAGLGSFIPWTWRRWFREHLPAAAPALEALAVVVAVGIAGGFSPPPAQATQPVQVQAASEAKPKPVARPRAAEVDRPAAQRMRSAPAAARDSGSAAPAAAVGQPAEATPDKPRIISRVQDSVKVKREYPKESEELLDVTLISNKDSHTARLYGNQVTDTAATVVEPTKDLLGAGDN